MKIYSLRAECVADADRNRAPAITINGVALNRAQSIAVRVAIEAYVGDLLTRGLGDDEHGKAMTSAYLARLYEVQDKLLNQANH